MRKINLKLKYGLSAVVACLFFAVILSLIIIMLQVLFLREMKSGNFSLYGDLNRDGIVDYRDGDKMAETLAEITANGGDVQETGLIDFNCDSVIDNRDTLYYYAYYRSQYFDRILFEEFVNKVNRKEVLLYE